MLIHRSVSKLLMHAVLLATSTVATQASNDVAVNDDNGRLLHEGQEHDLPDPSEYSQEEHGYIQGEGYNKPRDSDVIEFISTSDDRVTVKVKQNIIGDPEDCQASDKADFFFMVFKNGRTMEDICPFYRDVDACFERTVHIPCDPVSKTATITVYVKSAGDVIHELSSVPNPYVGRCFPDHLYERPELMTALSFTRTMQCGERRPKYCADVLVDDPSSEDGEYRLWPRPPAGQKAESRRIYCHNMRGPGKPEEYIDLQDSSTYSAISFSEGEASSKGYWQSRTWFDKIRVDMDTLKVDVADYTFTVVVGQPYGRRSLMWDRDIGHHVPFGSCQGSGKTARFKVGWWNTGFNIQDRTVISTSPHDPRIRAQHHAGYPYLTRRSDDGTWVNVGPVLADGLDTPKGTYNVQLIMVPE